jgi:predicted nucleic acid-binding protein
VPTYLADTSAWHRQPQAVARWTRLIERDEVVLCTPVALELLYSARDPTDYARMATELEGFLTLPIDGRVEVVARRTQAKLVGKGQHRGPTPVDLMIAAIAEVNDVVLLHYDRHFETISRATGQAAEWLARRGSLD